MSKIAFFGTPDFAATIFKGLMAYCNENGHTIEFAVCQPDKPKGRSQIVEPPIVKTLALDNNIRVFQPTTLKKGTPEGDSFFEVLESAALDLAVVVAYGRIIPKRMLAAPQHGFVNVHASLLPKWRGASPIQRSIQAGDLITGVSIMDLVPEMDAGDVYKMVSIPISARDDSATLSTKLAALGLSALLDSLENLLNGQLTKVPQDAEGITFAPKLTKDDGKISWTKTAQEIVNHARAMHPWPLSHSILNGRNLKLFGAHVPAPEQEATDLAAGTIMQLGDVLVVKCRDSVVAFNEIQFEGKRRMSIRDVKNGNLIRQGEQFSTDG